MSARPAKISCLRSSSKETENFTVFSKLSKEIIDKNYYLDAMASLSDGIDLAYDQNAALAELDRILRSTNLAEKCDGIVKLPQYFEKFPFPWFITSSFLRLVEHFRNGTNVTRKWILHVAERSEKHLDKIISRDELMKGILTVSHSNDPNARALTMKLFAYFARILADRKQMHHLICTSLDSNDTGELHAAIFAAQRFAKHSPEFGRSVLDKSMEMLMSIDVPPETKLLLVPVFEHFSSDLETSQKAVIFCRDQFLPQCHSSAVTGALLTALTKLAVHAVTVAPVQLELLLMHVKSEKSSKHVLMTALDCLHYLAKDTPHLWTSDAVKILCEFCDKNGCGGESGLLRSLRVLITLTRSHVSRLWTENDLQQIAELCSKHCYSDSHWITSSACVIAMHMVENLVDSAVRDQLKDTLVLSLTTAILTWPWTKEDQSLLPATRMILRCVLQVSKLDSVTAQTLARCLLSVVSSSCSGVYRNVINECILALCDADLTVADWLQRFQLDTPISDQQLRNDLMVVPKWTVPLIDEKQISTEQLLAEGHDEWGQFKFGRRALRYGHASVAKDIFKKLQDKVELESFRQWFKSLSILATAEEFLNPTINQSSADHLSSAIYHYQLAQMCIKAASTPLHSRWFQIAFIQLRQCFLNAVKELHTVWDVAVLVPPSAVAVVDTTSTEVKATRLISQLSNCETRFGEISQDYETLTRRCFDADDGTVQLLKLLRMQCFLVQHAIRAIIGPKDRKSYNVQTCTCNAQTRILSKHMEWLSAEVLVMHEKFDGISKQAIEYLLAVIDRVCFNVPFFMPRFFFQSLQTTTIKLAIFPKPDDRENTMRVPGDQRLLLNVEGVVSVVGPKAKVFRRIERVIVRVNVEYGSSVNTPENKAISTWQDANVRLGKTVPLLNDYFSADFMLDFPVSGTVNVHVDLVDAERGMLWDGNAEEHLRVKVLQNTAGGLSLDWTTTSMRAGSGSISGQRSRYVDI